MRIAKPKLLAIKNGNKTIMSAFSSFLSMGVTLAIFSLSGKIPCDKVKSKVCFSGAANSSKQRLITLALTSSIPGLLLGLGEKNASFSSFTETNCNSNLAFMESI